MLTIFVLLCTIPSVSSYGTGAPTRVCGDMTPQHHVDPQTSLAPYLISVQGQKINPGQSISSINNGGRMTFVSLRGKEQGKLFKGFLVEVRNVANNEAIGHFDEGDVWQTLDCFDKQKSGITHVNKTEKSDLTATWTAPRDFQGKATAWATFVENGGTFWVNVTSNAFEVSGESLVDVGQQSTPFKSTYDGCFETKGCFGGPAGCISSKNCKHLVTYVTNKDRVEVEMVGESKGWIAVGFSRDDKMGDDAVTACVINGSNERVDVYQSWNKPNDKDNIALKNLRQGLSNINTESVDGFINCRFTLEGLHVIVDDFTSNDSPVETSTFNLINESYVLFLGRGQMFSLKNPVRMNQHLANPYVSEQAVNLKEDMSEIGVASDLLIKLHGSLMVAAWVGTVGIAIFLARYFKNVWPTEKHCGEKIWFTWHRALNILTLLLNVAAFILIFVHLKGWSEIWKHNPHPILGVVVTFLVILQPIIAAFRCHPGTPKRPIFNWLHFLVGNSAHILAVVTLFFAKSLKKANLPEMFMWALIGFVVFHVVVFLVMELYTCSNGNKVRDNQIALKDMTNGNAFTVTAAEAAKNVGSRFRKILLLLYVFGNVGFVIALIVIISMSPVKER